MISKNKTGFNEKLFIKLKMELDFWIDKFIVKNGNEILKVLETLIA